MDNTNVQNEAKKNKNLSFQKLLFLTSTFTAAPSHPTIVSEENTSSRCYEHHFNI